MNSRLIEMITRGRLPLRGGQWIDTYNQITNPDYAGTIISGINAKNHYFVTDMEEPIINVVGELNPDDRMKSGCIRQQNYVIGSDGISMAITAKHLMHQFKVAVLGWTRDKKGKVIDRHPVEVANAVTAVKRDNTQNYVVNPNYRIRKLTPRECFRLMGVRDEDIDKIQAAGLSKTQQYKMAGNSIVINCLAAIFR